MASLFQKLVDDVRTNIVGMVVASLVSGTFIAGCVALYRAIAKLGFDWWFVIATFVFVSLAVLTAILIASRSQGASQQGTMQNVSNTLVAPSTFDAATFFRLSYYGPLQSEIEANTRAAATKNQPNDREGFYVRLIATILIAHAYDTIWHAIYGSQLMSLLELNRRNGLLPLAEIKAYYDKAVADHPAAYAAYSFDQWMSFMHGQTLIIRHPSDMVEITVRGKDFLKYLLHWGREANQRPL